jgi:hypothetical protein
MVSLFARAAGRYERRSSRAEKQARLIRVKFSRRQGEPHGYAGT